MRIHEANHSSDTLVTYFSSIFRCWDIKGTVELFVRCLKTGPYSSISTEVRFLLKTYEISRKILTRKTTLSRRKLQASVLPTSALIRGKNKKNSLTFSPTTCRVRGKTSAVKWGYVIVPAGRACLTAEVRGARMWVGGEIRNGGGGVGGGRREVFVRVGNVSLFHLVWIPVSAVRSRCLVLWATVRS